MENLARSTVVTVQSLLILGLAAALAWSVKNRQSDQVVVPVVSPAPRAVAPRAVAPRTSLASEESSRVELYRRAAPSVVNISAVRQYRDISGRVRETPGGTGTGVVWDSAGHVVTNFHILENADVAYVTLEDGSSYRASLAGKFADKDLAVLRVEAPPEALTPVLVGTSDDLEVGQDVLAIGNPFGLSQTLTSGVISGLGREITSVNGRPIQDVIQTDAAINPGNSGGPLFDSSGRMIGVNTQILSTSGASAGIGFAIPIDTVNRIVPQLIKTGKVTAPVLGVTSLAKSDARRYGLPGVVVLKAHPGEPAAAAGIVGTHRDASGRWALGDIILAIDGVKVSEPNDIFRILDRHERGDRLDVEILRDGNKLTVTVTLG